MKLENYNLTKWFMAILGILGFALYGFTETNYSVNVAESFLLGISLILLLEAVFIAFSFLEGDNDKKDRCGFLTTKFIALLGGLFVGCLTAGISMLVKRYYEPIFKVTALAGVVALFLYINYYLYNDIITQKTKLQPPKPKVVRAKRGKK